MNPKSRLVGIMVNQRDERIFALQKYLFYNSAPIKLFSFMPSGINWQHKTIIGIHRHNGKWVQGKFAFPQVVFNRCYESDSRLIERLEKEIGRNRCFNEINRFNKFEAYQRLSEWLSPHLPETAMLDKENAVRFLNQHKVIYLKPCFGNNGKGVFRAELTDTGEIHIGHHHFLPEIIANDAVQFQEIIQQRIGSTPYIVQQGVHVRKVDEQVFDIRVLAQKNREGFWTATNVVSRVAHRGCFNTSVCEQVCLSEEVLKRIFPPETINSTIGLIYDLSLRTAEIMELHAGYHLGEISVDFALDWEGRIWIIEINGKPRKDLYDGIGNKISVYMRPMQYAQYLCNK